MPVHRITTHSIHLASSVPDSPSPSQSVRTETVDRETKRILDIVQKAMDEVRSIMKHGPGNVRDVVVKTGGKSYASMRNCRTSRYASKKPAKGARATVARVAARAMKTEGGNCYEYAHLLAAVLNRELDLNVPVQICEIDPGTEPEDIHEIVVVGDMASHSEGQVIGDAWAPEGQAIRAQDSIFDVSSLQVIAAFAADGRSVVQKRLSKVRTGPEYNLQPNATLRLGFWKAERLSSDGSTINYVIDLELREDVSLWTSRHFSTVPDPRPRFKPYSAHDKGAPIERPVFVQRKDMVFCASPEADANGVRSVRIEAFREVDGLFYRVPWADLGSPAFDELVASTQRAPAILQELKEKGRYFSSAVAEHARFLLGHASPASRLQALEYGQRTTLGVALECVEALLHDTDVDVRAQTVEWIRTCRLSSHPVFRRDARGLLLERMKANPDPKVHREILKVFCAWVPGPGAAGLPTCLESALASPDPVLRAAGVDALATLPLPPKDYVRFLRRLEGETDDGVHASLVRLREKPYGRANTEKLFAAIDRILLG